MSAAVPGRVVCPRCGQNNFDTQAACWKCGSPLTAGGAGAYAPPVSGGGATPGMASAPRLTPTPETGTVAPVPMLTRAPGVVDPAVAIWSAVALAFFFPFIAVPVGMVFLMLDDRRKVEIGRVTLVWGILFSIVHTVITGMMIRGAIDEVKAMAGGLPGLRGSAPKLSDPVQNPFPNP